MATGTPSASTKNGLMALNSSSEVELSYPGKRPLNEIWRTLPAMLYQISAGSTNKRLYFAENLSVLAALAGDKDVCGKVRLVYIDPPYGTQTVFHSRKLTHAYEDILETAQYVDFMRERLAFLHRILAEDGSIYVHIDEKMVFHVKLVLDEIFGASNYRNCITRKKCNPKNYTRKTYGNVADYILFYSKSDKYVWNRQVEPWSVDGAKEYQYVEPETGRKYMKVPVHAPGIRNGETGKPWRGKLPPPGKHWQFTPETLEAMDAKGEIFWSSNGNPRRKVYLDQSAGIPVQDIWMGFRDAHNQNIQITGYPTEKNYDLLKRIVEASSDPGDIVLDCFAGSGTTLVAADTLRRNWIGIDNSPEALRTMLHRFANGTDLMGDFVEKKTKPAHPSLFEVMSKGEESQHSKIEFQRVKDFALFVDQANEALLENIIMHVTNAS